MVKIIILLLSIIYSSGVWAENKNFFDENFHHYQDSLEEAADENKLAIFVFFYLEDCPFCHKMRRQVLNQPEIISFYKKYFLNYELDANGSLEMVDFAGNNTIQRNFASKKYNVYATPVLAFFNLKGKVVAYRTGFLTKKDFLLFGKFVKDEQYAHTNFMRYKRQAK